MFKRLILLGGAAAILGTAVHAQELAGVSDEETAISSGQITAFYKGKADVLFVRDRVNKWYRVALNEGCLDHIGPTLSAAFASDSPMERIDRFTTVLIDGGERRCAIKSIRRSVAPPQVDSKSPITLD